ncbi:hypothetical protein [uncultured Propionibacterium sp.]|uniref:hypothetical protein n=1 Tax=uncultured Propionibacterium sp. TaxID=218066 RepID=UPI00292DF10C|nr:hypothetical protein [uncultured Propionibacterium sp.]
MAREIDAARFEGAIRLDQAVLGKSGDARSPAVLSGSGARAGSHGPGARPAQPIVPRRPAQPVPPAVHQGFIGRSPIPARLGEGACPCASSGGTSPGPVHEPVDDTEHVQVLSAEMLAAAVGIAPASDGARAAGERAHRRTRAAAPARGWRLTERGIAVVVTSFVAAVVLGLGGAVHSFLSISNAPVERSSSAVARGG